MGPHGSGRTWRHGEGIFKQERQVDGFRFLESHKPIMPLIICAFVGTSERREVASDSNYLLGGSVQQILPGNSISVRRSSISLPDECIQQLDSIFQAPIRCQF